MCRTGGPRCPDNPAKRARSNARKRLTYHAKKEGLSVEEYRQKHPEDAARHAHIPGGDTPTTVRNVESLVKPLDQARTGAFDSQEDHVDASREELSHLAPAERNVLAAYTTSRFHKKVNNALWTGRHVYDNPTGEVYPDLDTSTSEAVSSRVAARSINKAENFNAFVNTLDSAVDSVPTKDKTVYRGFTPNPQAIYTPEEQKTLTLADLYKPEYGERYHRHVAEAYAPGKTIHFPAYTSTTDSPEIATDFSVGGGQDGVVFEMHTYRGARISSLADDNADEQETLLPRDTHWKVVSNTHGQLAYRNNAGQDDITPGERHVITLVECDEDGNELDAIRAAQRKPRPVEGAIDFVLDNDMD